jgi:hypothetical protein
MSSLDKFNQTINLLSQAAADSAPLLVQNLQNKADEAVKQYPEDQTLGQMHVILDKMASNNKKIISRGDFKKLYNQLYSRDTFFTEVFANELGISAPNKESIKMAGEEVATDVGVYSSADPTLSNALKNMFDSQEVEKPYDLTLATQAAEQLKKTLQNLKVAASQVSIVDGNTKLLVLQAAYETPKGRTSFLIPLPVRNGRVIDPELILGNHGACDFSASNIQNYLKNYTGQKLLVNGHNLLNILTKTKQSIPELSDTEMALIKIKTASSEEVSPFTGGQILGQKLDEDFKSVEIPKLDTFNSFEEQFESAYGRAAFLFGQDKVKIAKDNIVRQILSFGYSHPQINVINSNQNTIFYGISLNGGKLAFTVPIKIENGKLNKPSTLLCNGSVMLFASDSLHKLEAGSQADFKVSAAACPLFNLKPQDLIQTIKLAMQEGNLAKAEDALNVLKNSGDDKFYQMGFEEYKDGLLPKSTIAEVRCSNMIKSSTSEHPICSHTGLPAHKVYQDKFGNCRPLHRKGFEDGSSQDAFFNGKLFG